MASKYKKLAFNTFLITAGGFISNGVGFFLLPFYTSYLSAGSVGYVDLINSTVILLIPVFTLSITDAVLRFCLEKESDKSRYFTTGLVVTAAGFLGMLLFIPLFLRVDFIKDNIFIFYLLYLVSAVRTQVTQFLRGIEKTKLYAVNEIVTSVCIVVLGVMLIYVLRLDMKGYLLSYAASYTVSVLFVVICGGLHRYLDFSKLGKQTFKDMARYSAPLIPNSISWWATNLLNRYILLYLCGAAVTGIFSVAGRLPVLITIVSTLVMQAWQISAITEYNSEDKNTFFSRVYQVYGSLIFCACSFLLTVILLIAQILFKGEFFEAWKYAPFLLLGTVFNCLAAFLGTIYLSAKRTVMNMVTTLAGAAVSIVLCLVLIPIFSRMLPFYGGFAAGIANIAGFAAIFLVRAVNTRKNVALKINYPCFVLSILILLAQSVITVLDMDYRVYINMALLLLVLGMNGAALGSLFIRNRAKSE